MDVRISQAVRADLPELLALLAAVDLPSEGVEEYLDGFMVARDAEGRLIGGIGLERHGSVGLLRSAAVSPDARGQDSACGSRQSCWRRRAPTGWRRLCY